MLVFIILTGHWFIFSKRPKSRKFPYPYRAALSILNDRHDKQSLDDFLEMHRFLNTDKETRFGPGLNLEIGDSFWFFQKQNDFSYFHNYTHQPTKTSEVIKAFIKAGYIDVLHAYGDFTNREFKRDFAEIAINELKKENLEIRVWTHHGDITNTQNLLLNGARRGTQEYHADLLVDYGIKFVWDDRLTDLIGQDRELKLEEIIKFEWANPFKTGFFLLKELIKKFLTKVEKLIKIEFDFYSMGRENKLLRIYELKDGYAVYSFSRFNNFPHDPWKNAVASYLPSQLSSFVLERLKEVEGYLIVYTHLEEGYPFEEEVVRTFERVKEEYEKGEIFVTTTFRLLRYNFVHNNLKWSLKRNNGRKTVIKIDPIIEDPVFGNYQLKPEDLQGITFYVQKSDEAEIFLGEEKLETRANPGDHKGRESIQVSISRLTFPPKYL